MPLLRVQNMVPQVYIKESRDFQLFTRLYDCVINGVKFDIDAIAHTIDSEDCNSLLLDLLKTKVGFFTDHNITQDYLRQVLEAFPYIIKYKGSAKGIQACINVFLKIYHIRTDYIIEYVTDPITQVTNGINIKIKSKRLDVSILKEMLKYVLPTGYSISIVFYSGVDLESIIYHSDEVTTTMMYIDDNSTVQPAIEGMTESEILHVPENAEESAHKHAFNTMFIYDPNEPKKNDQ